jgi:hypothetical protein
VQHSYYKTEGQKSRDDYLARYPLTAQNGKNNIGSKHTAAKAVKTRLNYYSDISAKAKHLLPTSHLHGPKVHKACKGWERPTTCA